MILPMVYGITVSKSKVRGVSEKLLESVQKKYKIQCAFLDYSPAELFQTRIEIFDGFFSDKKKWESPPNRFL